MYDPTQVYGYDIETMNDEERGFNGLDPSRSYITEIAVATDESINGGGEVFTGSEQQIIYGFARFLVSLKPGLMAGWNNTFFDNPFIDYRTRQVGIDFEMVLTAQPGLRAKYDPLPTAVTPENPNGGWVATFPAFDGGRHSSLDVAQAYRRFADEQGVKWGLKPVCEARGIDMFEIDRTRLHDYSPAERRRYVLSDGHGTRELALQMLGLDYTPYREA